MNNSLQRPNKQAMAQSRMAMAIAGVTMAMPIASFVSVTAKQTVSTGIPSLDAAMPSSITVHQQLGQLAPKTAVSIIQESVALDKMTKEQLMEKAGKEGVKVLKSWTKAKMIEALSAVPVA